MNEKVRLVVVMSREQFEALRDIATAQGLSVSALVRSTLISRFCLPVSGTIRARRGSIRARKEVEATATQVGSQKSEGQEPASPALRA
jgi:hypothetical protein